MRIFVVPFLAVVAATSAFGVISSSPPLEPTHRQVEVLKPMRGNETLTLNSFALDRDGNIVAAVAPQRSMSRGTNPGSPDNPRGWLQVYSPERKLLREIPLTFVPTALAIVPGGQYLAAGEGQIFRYDAEGKVLERTSIFTLLNVDQDKLRKEVVEDHKRDQQQYASSRATQLQAMRDQVARLEAKPQAERTARDNARMQSIKAMIQSLSASGDELSPQRIESMLQYRLRVPSLSATADGVVMTLARNRGYEVWRTGLKFENARRIIGDLRGCCGQMDMVTAGERVITAENTKFRVGIYNLEGQIQGTFGERYREGNNGFGSCCNPMNVLCCPNGDIITAESSIGHIKRFSSDGKLLAVIGRARIGGGCKHVSLGFDEKRDRYYVQYQDMNQICVMLPAKEAAPLVAEQDRLLKEADTAALKFVGKWVAVPPPGAGSRPPNNEVSAFDYDPTPQFESFSFNADHSLTLGLVKKTNPEENGFRRWYAARNTGDGVHFEVETADGYVEFTADVTPKGTDQIEVKFSRETKLFKRQR